MAGFDRPLTVGQSHELGPIRWGRRGRLPAPLVERGHTDADLGGELPLAQRSVAISLQNPLAVDERSVLANRFGDLHEPKLATAAEICLAGVSNTDTLKTWLFQRHARPPMQHEQSG